LRLLARLPRASTTVTLTVTLLWCPMPPPRPGLRRVGQAICASTRLNTDPDFPVPAALNHQGAALRLVRSTLLWFPVTYYFKPPHSQKYHPAQSAVQNEATSWPAAVAAKPIRGDPSPWPTSCWARSREIIRSSGRPSSPDSSLRSGRLVYLAAGRRSRRTVLVPLASGR